MAAGEHFPDGIASSGLEEEIASRIQASILPGEVDIEGLEIAAGMIPAEKVGGDYYDIIPVEDGCWIAIGDVAGHGLAAGLIMLMIQSALQGLVMLSPDASPQDLVCALNRVLYENIRKRMKRDEHVTFCLVRYWADGRMAFAGAHESMLICRADGVIETLAPAGAWLGARRDIRNVTADRTGQLNPGDAMLLYTDGVTEARNADGDQLGEEGLKRLLVHAAGGGPIALRDSVIRAVRDWAPAVEDDVTVVVVRCQGVYWE